MPAPHEVPFGPEWTLLERLCSKSGTPGHVSELLDLFTAEGFDTDHLVGHAMRHNLLAALGELVDRPRARALMDKRVRSHLRQALDATRARNAALTEHAVRVTEALESAGLTVAVTKGMTLQFQVYDGRGTRLISDIDLMILPEERAAVTAVLSELGHEVATYDRYSCSLKPLPREIALRYKLSPDHLPPMHALHRDPLVSVVRVDCATSLTWASCPWQVSTEQALARVDRVPCLPPPAATGEESARTCTLPALTPAYGWLFTVLHLFREAWVHRTIQTQRTTLAQFRDVVQMWHRFGGTITAELCTVLRSADLWYPVAWVCEHTDRLLGTGITTALGLDGLLPQDDLNSALGSNGEILSWPGTMRERLYRTDVVPLSPRRVHTR